MLTSKPVMKFKFAFFFIRGLIHYVTFSYSLSVHYNSTEIKSIALDLQTENVWPVLFHICINLCEFF